MSVPLLDVRGLSVRFPVRGGLFGRSRGVVHAVEDVSFTIDAGETLGIVGESGCGKSTLARALLGLVSPAAGEARWNGKNIVGLDEVALRAVRRDLRMVFQDPFASLDPRMTIGTIVREPLDLFEPQLEPRERNRIAHEMLERVGLAAGMGARYPHELSGGQCQRVNIARALVGSPRLVVCDESVSALDVSIQAQILNLLAELQRSTGVAMLFISHDLNVVRHVSHRVLVLYLGRVMEYADAATLFATPRHPYTRALLDAAPVADPRIERARERTLLHGDLPSPINPPSGCVFRTRCPEATHRCMTEVPLPRECGDGDLVACHYARSP